MEKITLKCELCGVEFKRPKSVIDEKLRMGRKTFYCSRGCSDQKPNKKKKCFFN